jgi:Pyruvate/2-oxoacid:ferredoxin oxidoreductase delta subunit
LSNDPNGNNCSKVGPIGKAHLDLDACLTSERIICDRCAVTCPEEVKAITMRGRRPVLDPQRCIGCGLCVLYCEADPKALEVVPLGAK